jgi:hypothetical protein
LSKKKVPAQMQSTDGSIFWDLENSILGVILPRLI